MSLSLLQIYPPLLRLEGIALPITKLSRLMMGKVLLVTESLLRRRRRMIALFITKLLPGTSFLVHLVVSTVPAIPLVVRHRRASGLSSVPIVGSTLLLPLIPGVHRGVLISGVIMVSPQRWRWLAPDLSSNSFPAIAHSLVLASSHHRLGSCSCMLSTDGVELRFSDSTTIAYKAVMRHTHICHL